MTSITVVVDNQPGLEGLTPEWGLALWIEHQDQAILYDTGMGPALLPNLAALGLDPARLAAVVISHGHLDHMGGLGPLLQARGGEPLPVWCHVGTFEAHYKQEADGSLKDIGPPLGGRAPYEDLGAHFKFVDVYAHPWPGVHLLAPIPRVVSHEEPAPGLVTLLGPAVVPDPVTEDLVVVIQSGSGPLVLTACAHAGPANILEHVRQVMAAPVAWLIGGLHLDTATPLHRQNSLAYLVNRQGLRLAVGHCTGPRSQAALAQALGARLTPLSLGLRLEF
ncbi:MAG: MBL fold metallo-hydrolase [Desulfarculus sp.]|nr:MBL fold metallo-hydrolase [Desulfarculus sp.]